MAKKIRTKSRGLPPKPRKKIALGRGLDALIPDIDTLKQQTSNFIECDIEMIRPNPFQPRRRFSEEELQKLSLSIKAQGIIQPLLLRKADVGYELVAGERRLRAARMAGLTQVPALVKEISDTELLEISIVENIQREDLNPIEEADGYQRLISEFNLTQDQAAERVGKSRSAVANILRLRQLPDAVKESIREGVLTMGHARALLGIETTVQRKAAWKIVLSKKLSVRETERLVKRLKNTQSNLPKAPVDSDLDSEDFYFAGLADDMARQLGTKVIIKRRGKKGKIEIDFYGDDDLNRLIELFRQV